MVFSDVHKNAPSTISRPSKKTKSSILKSSFSPSKFQLSLFASVIRGIGSETLRIHDTSSGLLKNDYNLSSNASVTCLQWGQYSSTESHGRPENSRKRKRSRHLNNTVLAFGTSLSEICLYSPQEAKIVGVLKDGHAQAIKDFKFVEDGLGNQAWSVGGDSKIVQWDLAKRCVVRTIAPPTTLVNTLELLGSSLLYASHVAYLQDLAFSKPPVTYNASTNPVRFIVTRRATHQQSDQFITAAQNDRHLSVFKNGLSSLLGTLRTESEVKSLDLSSSTIPKSSESTLPNQTEVSRIILVTAGQDGVLEVFLNPFDFVDPHQQNGTSSVKDRMKGRNRRSAARVSLTLVGREPMPAPLVDVSINGDHILVAWADAGVDIRFKRIKWKDEATGELVLRGNINVACEKGNVFDSKNTMNGSKNSSSHRLDESNAIVTNGAVLNGTSQNTSEPMVIDISSAEEPSSSDADSEDSAPVQSTSATSVQERLDSGNPDYETQSRGEMDLTNTNEEHEDSSLTFGELLKASAPNPVDVTQATHTLLDVGPFDASDTALQHIPSGLSLSTVLTQSLKTDDRSLLRSCFQVKDLATIRTTIERLASDLAPELIQTLAQLLHSRPGRAGNLMVWVQWTLICHGGSLAGRTDVMKNLSSLHRVVKQRADSLQSLLSLKGKLDMLEAQMNIRERLRTSAQRLNDVDEGAVIYVEGQSEDSSDSESEPDERATEGESGQNTAHDVSAGPDNRMQIGDDEFSASEDSDSDEEAIDHVEVFSTDDESRDGSSSEEVNYEDIDTASSEGPASPLIKGRSGGLAE